KFYFFIQAEDGIRDRNVTGVQTCALPISQTVKSATSWHPISCARGLSLKTAPMQTSRLVTTSSCATSPWVPSCTRSNCGPAAERSAERRVGKREEDGGGRIRGRKKR